jgi:alpha-beta hydrolase superfamily lysophospholipase
VHGWSETWYAWRLLMPALARDFEVVAVDQRGIGLTDKPKDGYDSATLAGDLVALMDALGHQQFHFIHVKSPHENALPLIITHGWPGSVIEMLNVVGPLSCRERLP